MSKFASVPCSCSAQVHYRIVKHCMRGAGARGQKASTQAVRARYRQTWSSPQPTCAPRESLQRAVGNGVPCYEVGYKNLDLVKLVLLDHRITALGDAQVAPHYRITALGI